MHLDRLFDMSMSGEEEAFFRALHRIRRIGRQCPSIGQGSRKDGSRIDDRVNTIENIA